MRPTFHLAMLGVMGAGFLAGCPDEEAQTAAEAATELPAKVEIPDRVRSAQGAVALRINGGASTTSTSVHRAIARIFDQQISAVDGVMRGGRDTTGKGIAGTAADQVQQLLTRITSGEGPLEAGEAVDRCGNPMLASFLTADSLASVVPEGAPLQLGDLVSEDASADGAGKDTTRAGVWDVTLTEMRFDGMVDAYMTLYPAVREERPAFFGHLMAFFLTDAHPGSYQVPLYTSAQRVQLNAEALLERWAGYTDRHYGDAREIFVFPHQERTVSTSSLSVTFIDDPLCDYTHANHFSGSLPYGCNMVAEDGRDVPVMLDTDSRLGAAVYEQLTDNGNKPDLLQTMQDVLSYQISAFLACPSFDEGARVVDGPVEILVCPEGDFETCVGTHDMEQAACDYQDETAFPATEFTTGTITGSSTAPTLTPSDFPYLLTFGGGLGGDDGGGGLGGGFGGTGMQVTLDLAAGEEVYIRSDQASRLTYLDPNGQAVSTSTKTNTHCGNDLTVLTAGAAGAYRVQATGESDLRILVTRPDLHLP
jgi:hypothetical protein